LAEAEAEARSITTSRGVGASRSNGHAANGHLADGHAAASVTGAARASRGAGTHGALAATLTRISATAAQHLGRSVIANYWRQCQREEAVEIFEARQDGSIRALSFDAPASASTVAVASAWARSFVARCALIVVDIEDGLVASLDDEAQALIGAAASEGRVA